MEILQRDSLELGGFAGLKEHRLVTGSKAFGSRRDPATWDGIGNFVYLADAVFNPKGETTLHNHQEIDVISVMVEGRIAHKGTLENGREMKKDQAQAQRAGGEGFSHNEINPDDAPNRMIQLWVVPERSGDLASYKFYDLKTGELTRIYGGTADQAEALDSHTFIDVGLFNAGQSLKLTKPVMAYLTRGTGTANGQTINEGDLLRANALEFKAESDTQIIVIHTD